jgi:hypothetical protein
MDWCTGISKATEPDEGGKAPLPTITPDEKLTVEAPVGAAKLLVTRDAPSTTLPEASELRKGWAGPVAPSTVASKSDGSGVGAGCPKSEYIYPMVE